MYKNYIKEVNEKFDTTRINFPITMDSVENTQFWISRH